MPSRITEDAASRTDGETSARSPSIDHVAGSCQRSRTLRRSSSIGQAGEDAADLVERPAQLVDRPAERLDGLRRRDLDAVRERLELKDGRGDHLREPVVDRVRETSPVALDRRVEIRGDLEHLVGSSEALGGRRLAPERHRFHRPPFSFVFFWHGLLAWSRGARRSVRACVGAHLRSVPPSEGTPSPFGLVLISVVRGGGLNAPVQGT
jgi:hypothetical protein